MSPGAQVRAIARAVRDWFDGVSTLGVDEHVWHHTPHKSQTKGSADVHRGSIGPVTRQDGSPAP